MSPANAKRLRNITRLSLLLLVLFGIALRFAGYLANRSLWGDEVFIALNLRFRDFSGLLRPLDYDQTMPIALLLAIKSLTSLFGYSEHVLRLPLLLVGCLLLATTAIAFSRLFGARIALISVALMAIYRPLIYYSSELKQYELDALITLITIWLGLKTLQEESDSYWPILILWGMVAIFLSQPAVFVLAAVGFAAVVIDSRFRSSSKWRAYCFVAAAVWLSVFAGLFWFSYRPVSQSQYMQAFWHSSFLRVTAPNLRQEFSSAIHTILGGENFNHLRTFVLLLLFAAGIYGILKTRGWRTLVVAVGPFLAVFAAAMLKAYPIATRLLLFLVPLLFWIYASGVATAADFFPPKLRIGAVIVLFCGLFGPTTIASIRYAVRFPLRETTRQLSAEMESTDPTAPVYMVFGKYLQWAYYTGDWSHSEVLKARIDATYSCLRSKQLAYVGFPETDRCDEPPAAENSMKQPEIIGLPPPGPSEGVQKDQEWASSEAQKIVAQRQNYVWLFLPIYNETELTGYLMQRKMLEKLEGELVKDGARLVNRDSLGDSIALRYELHSSQKPAPN